MGSIPSGVKLPKALSKGEETFSLHMKARGLVPAREFVFCPGRKWRFDFAFPECIMMLPHQGIRILRPVGIEIEGGTRAGGRHTRHAGYSADLDKYNTASRMGWLVLRYTTEMVMSGQADREVAELMGVA